jgi:hypothetical protein
VQPAPLATQLEEVQRGKARDLSCNVDCCLHHLATAARFDAVSPHAVLGLR